MYITYFFLYQIQGIRAYIDAPDLFAVDLYAG
jgi:hypothetical protein